ncbi:hypothetical protein KI387_004448, partial [Taxus chinensis]
PPVNAICDTKESREDAEIDKLEGEIVEDYEGYLKIEEVNMHNGLFEFVDDGEEEEEAPSFSCVVFTRAQSKKYALPSMAQKEKKTKEDPTPATTQKKIISRGSPLPPLMDSTKMKLGQMAARDQAVIS